MADEIFGITLQNGAEKLGLKITDEEALLYEKAYDMLCDENTRQNLTRITIPDEAAEKHILDCLTVSEFIKDCQKVCDIGCGAGFPVIPLAVSNPHIAFTAVDSTEKKIRYVKKVSDALLLKNVEVLSARAEDMGKSEKYREKFDAVTARAVAALNVLCEYCLPLVKVGGAFIAMKANADEEIANSEKAVNTLGGKITDIRKFRLPFSQSERTVIKIEKIAHTPLGYPRAGGAISKKPL